MFTAIHRRFDKAMRGAFSFVFVGHSVTLETTFCFDDARAITNPDCICRSFLGEALAVLDGVAAGMKSRRERGFFAV
jgi:hypothetical protein